MALGANPYGGSPLGSTNVGRIPISPTNLIISTTNSDAIKIEWQDNSTAENAFNIYRSTSSGSSISDYTKVTDIGENTTIYEDTSLISGKEYHYRVTASNNTGESDPTNEATSVTTLLPPSNVTIDPTTEGQVDLSWTKQDDNSEGEFEIFRSTDPTSIGTKIADGIGVNTTSYTDTGINTDTAYYYTVRRVTPK